MTPSLTLHFYPFPLLHSLPTSPPPCTLLHSLHHLPLSPLPSIILFFLSVVFLPPILSYPSYSSNPPNHWSRLHSQPVTDFPHTSSCISLCPPSARLVCMQCHLYCFLLCSFDIHVASFCVWCSHCNDFNW